MNAGGARRAVISTTVGERQLVPSFELPTSNFQLCFESSSTRIQQRVEDNPKRPKRLSPPLRPEPEQNHVPAPELYVERGGLTVQMLFAHEIARQERRAAL